MSENLRWSVHPGHGPYAEGLDRNPANHAPLTPLSFLLRTAAVYPERAAVVHGRIRRTYRELLERSLRLASALERRGIQPGDTVAAMNHAEVAEDLTYVSTAGGAFLEWMEGKPLPGVDALRV